MEEEYFAFLLLFLFLEQEVEQPNAEPNAEANDYTGEASQGIQNMVRRAEKLTHWKHMIMTITTTSTSTSRWRWRQWRQILKLSSKVFWQILILLSIRSRDLSSRTERIIWNDCVCRGQRQGIGNIVKAKRWNRRLMRGAMALRAVQNTIVTFMLSCSSASSLRGIWRSFWPSSKINTIIRNLFKLLT